jgi:hypothetical protein
MKVAVVGSRSFNNYVYLWEVLHAIDLRLCVNKGSPIHEIISGGARGADTLAEQFAKKENLPLKVFPAEWDKYGKSAGFRRNQQIVDNCDILIAFWDGESRGTKHSIDLATKQNKPVYIYTDWKGN